MSWFDPRDWSFPNPLDWPGQLTGWLEEKAATAALYLLLTVAALFLIVQGATRSMGTSPLQLASTVRGGRVGRNAQTDKIPF